MMGEGYSAIETKASAKAKLSIKPSNSCLNLFPRKIDARVVPFVAVEIPLQISFSRNDELPTTAYGCCFCPNNDSVVATVSVRKHHPINFQNGRQQFFNLRTHTGGFVTVWRIYRDDNTDDENGREMSCGNSESSDEADYIYEECSPTFFTYSPKPCCTFSKDGMILTTILHSSKQSLTLAERESTLHNTTDIWFSHVEMKCLGNGGTTLCGRVLCAVLTADEERLVTVSKVSLSAYREKHINEVCLWKVINRKQLRSMWMVSCEVLCKEFDGVVINCKFSADSTVLGLSSTNGDTIFVFCSTGTMFGSISHSQNLNSNSSPCDFDFDPTKDCVVAVVWEMGSLIIGHIKNDEFSIVSRHESCEERLFSNAIQYSYDGDLLAVATLTGQVLLFDTKFGINVCTLDASQDIMVNEIDNFGDLAVFGVSFSKSCQELAAAYNDGVIRIWQLPKKLNLQHICKLEILTRIPACNLTRLPLPWHLIEYLLL